MANHENYYEVLGLPNYANIQDVTARFKELARKHHPDLGGDLIQMQRISNAYDILKRNKSQYDAWLKSKLEPPQQIVFTFYGSWGSGSTNSTTSSGWY